LAPDDVLLVGQNQPGQRPDTPCYYKQAHPRLVSPFPPWISTVENAKFSAVVILLKRVGNCNYLLMFYPGCKCIQELKPSAKMVHAAVF